MFERNEGTANITQFNTSTVDEVKSTSFLSKVFGRMTIWLLVTTIVSIGLGILFSWLLTRNPVDSEAYQNTCYAFFAVLGVSFVGVLVCSILMNIGTAFKKLNLKVIGTIYSVLMGVSLSTIVMFVPWWIIAMAFGITTLIFGLMFVIAKTTKANLTPVGLVGRGLLGGAFLFMLIFGIIALINFFSNNPFLSWTMYWLYTGIDAVIFIAIILITMYEMWNVVKIAQKGEGSEDLATYMAFSLYVDFVYILIRVIYILLRIFGNKK